MDQFADFDTIGKDYTWPASRLTKGDMMRLTELRERLGEPITKLLDKAVMAYYRTLSEAAERAVRCCDHPRKGTLENATIECACGFSLADNGQLIDWLAPVQIAWEAEE